MEWPTIIDETETEGRNGLDQIEIREIDRRDEEGNRKDQRGI